MENLSIQHTAIGTTFISLKSGHKKLQLKARKVKSGKMKGFQEHGERISLMIFFLLKENV